MRLHLLNRSAVQLPRPRHDAGREAQHGSGTSISYRQAARVSPPMESKSLCVMLAPLQSSDAA
eukprot:2448378-Pyramimonas_sp.AAC.1